LFTVLAKVGLKLEPNNAPMEVVIVDAADKPPSGNSLDRNKSLGAGHSSTVVGEYDVQRVHQVLCQTLREALKTGEEFGRVD
jgi:hypothetical protein